MSLSPPMVSIIIPAYNARAQIGEAIASVERQRYAPLEIIVVDDGSQDDTGAFVRRNHPGVRLITQANGGAARARNTGMRAARGDLFAFLDADDLWLPGKLRTQVEHLRHHPQVGLVCTAFSRWYPDTDGRHPPPVAEAAGTAVIDEIDPERSGWIYHKLLLSCDVWTSTVIIRRSVAEQVGPFDESLRLGQDYDYWLRVSRETEIHTLKHPFALYRQHPLSATARGARINYGARVLTRALARWGHTGPDGASVPLRLIRRRIAGIHFMNGYGHYRRGDYPLARRAFLAAALIRPARLRNWAYLLLSLAWRVRRRGGAQAPG